MKKIIFFIFTVIIGFPFIIENAYTQTGIISGYDPDERDLLMFYKYETSSYLKDNSSYDYRPKMAFDGKPWTAWCMKGRARGEWAKFYFKESQWHYFGVMNVYGVLIMNGLSKSKKLYFANNRVKKIKFEFSGGQKRYITLRDGVLNYQKFVFNIKAHWVKLTILDTYRGNKFNDTCISEIEFETWFHPDDDK